MARKINTEKEKKKSKKNMIIIFMIIIVIIGGGCFYVWKFGFRKTQSKAQVVTVLDKSLDEYGYALTDKDSKYFKAEYEELKEILKKDKVDEKEYATKVARMFVIDFYTLSTKLNKYDVGGTEFFYDKKREMFENKAMDTVYSSLLDNTYGDRKQELPEVINVETVSMEETTYSLGEEKVDGYLVKLNISYKEEMKYDDEASIVVCKEEGMRWSVVDFQPTLKPEYKVKKDK